MCGEDRVCFYPGCNPRLVEAGVNFKEIKPVEPKKSSSNNSTNSFSNIFSNNSMTKFHKNP